MISIREIAELTRVYSTVKQNAVTETAAKIRSKWLLKRNSSCWYEFFKRNS